MNRHETSILKEIRIRTASTADLDTLMAIDADACVLFEHAGLHLELPDGHEFAVAERERWLRCLRNDSALIASDSDDQCVAFVAMDELDSAPYVAQLSVRLSHMRLGIGTCLLNKAIDMARFRGGNALWLTTYEHLPWNRPFYERSGFVIVDNSQCGQDIRSVQAFERRWLPLPEKRIIMCKALRTPMG